MEENDTTNLDVEFKRYLQILRPYLGQLVDQDIIEVCNSWIQRLSHCKEEEKAVRNKYVFELCYQLARGVLNRPFLKFPPDATLAPLSVDITSDESSTEVEYICIDYDDPKTKIIFDSENTPVSNTELVGQDSDNTDHRTTEERDECDSKVTGENKTNSTRKQTILCYNYPEIHRNYAAYDLHHEEYEYRANNLIKKLREIKIQNRLLNNELIQLKNESSAKSEFEEFNNDITKVSLPKDACIHSQDSNSSLKCLKGKLQELQESRNVLIDTISNLQDKLDHLNEHNKHEIEELEAKHKLEIIRLKTATREETKAVYEQKFDEMKNEYENTIKNIEFKTTNHTMQVAASKDEIIIEKDKLISMKDAEIAHLKSQLEEQKNSLHSVLNRFLEKPSDELSGDNMKEKAHQLERRLNKMEKSKTKCAKVYEAKLAHLQREKHLAECSLQLQLVRQRAQVVNEVSGDNQLELTTAIDKLETKYKDIVANMQATAIQRRMQDQIALETILKAACGLDNNNYSNNQGVNSHKTTRNQNQNYDSDISALLRGNKVGNVIVGNKSFGEDSVMTGFCLNGERMGELFDKVYIPQRDGEPLK